MNFKIKIDKKIIAVILFFVCFMVVQRMNNPYALILYFFVGELVMFFYLRASKNVDSKIVRLFCLILFFWFQEFTSAQEFKKLRHTVYGVECILILYIFMYSFCNIKRINKRQFKFTTMILGLLFFINLVGVLNTYESISIFAFSIYDSCKYFGLIYYMLALRIDKEQFKQLLNLMSGIVIMHTICAIFQFCGKTVFFDMFRGRYKIVSRMGNYRAIGMFPYSIELGNYCCILFAIYYNFSKLFEKEKNFYNTFIEICLLLCIIVSGTRISIVNVALIFILSNISNIKKWLKTFLIMLCVIIVGSNFVNVEEMIRRTKWDVSIELPRTYYFKKGLEIWEDHPFFGIGFNTYGSAKYRERTDDIIFNTYNLHKFDYANLSTTDSFVAEIIPEFGFFGILVLVIYGIYIYNYYLHKKKKNDFSKIFIYVILSIFIMSINTSTAFINSHIGTWFWIACGMILDSRDEEKILKL